MPVGDGAAHRIPVHVAIEDVHEDRDPERPAPVERRLVGLDHAHHLAVRRGDDVPIPEGQDRSGSRKNATTQMASAVHEHGADPPAGRTGPRREHDQHDRDRPRAHDEPAALGRRADHAASSIATGEQPERLEIAPAGRLHHLGRELRRRRLAVPPTLPPKTGQVVAQRLLVEAGLGASGLVPVGRPEAGRVGCQHLVYEQELAVRRRGRTRTWCPR